MHLEIMIPSDEPVRILSAVLEELDYRKLTTTYSYIGRIEYALRLLFQVVLYACTRGIYSCRENMSYDVVGKRAGDLSRISCPVVPPVAAGIQFLAVYQSDKLEGFQ